MSDNQTAASEPASEDARASTVHEKMAAVRRAVTTMNDFRLNDTRPFGTDARDIVEQCAEGAHALCVLMSVAIDELAGDNQSDSLPLRPIHLARAFHGIATLVALGVFAAEGEGE